MKSTLVYDLPTRIFHWLFAITFLTAFGITKLVDDESLAFTYHMLCGLFLSGLIIWRIIWGLIGTDHARFSGFSLNPFQLKDYLLGILKGSQKRWAGHNPASSWAALVMFALGLSLAATGFLMTTGSKSEFEDIHEILANTFIIVAIMHVAGVILHTIRHKDAIALSMIDGKKQILEQVNPIQSSKTWAAAVLLSFALLTGLAIYKNFDSQNRTMKLFGKTLQLGESEDENDMDSKGENDTENEVENDD